MKQLRRGHSHRNPYGLLQLSADDDAWMDQGICRLEAIPRDVFFPTRGEPEHFVEAYQACDRCSVQRPCLEFALKHNLQGIWGKTSGRERRKMRRTKVA